MCSVIHSEDVADVLDYFCDRESRIFGQPDFYDSMMVDVTTDERMDEVSSHGYAWGYIGSCVPFVISLLLVLGGDKVGISTPAAMTAAFFLNAAWWGL